MKTCTKCGITKPLTEYYANKRGVHGKAAACKQCLTEVYAKHRRDNLEHYNQVRADLRHRNRTRYNEWKSQQCCLLCGEDELCCLDLHHLDPDSKEMNIGDVILHKPWDKLKAELDKCVVLCSNCHRKVHANLITLL